jgi:hypothetical protein
MCSYIVYQTLFIRLSVVAGSPRSKLTGGSGVKGKAASFNQVVGTHLSM